MSTAAATRISPPPAKEAMGMLTWRVDVTIIRWIHEAIVGSTVVPTNTSCVHRITHRMTDWRHGSKDVVLIMLSGWMSASGGVHGSQRCKTKWTYWVVRQWWRQRLLCRLNIGLARSLETDQDNSWSLVHFSKFLSFIINYLCSISGNHMSPGVKLRGIPWDLRSPTSDLRSPPLTVCSLRSTTLFGRFY